MKSRIQEQATKVWESVTASGTISTYQQAIVLTWNLIKESALLIWLVTCLILVAADWFTAYSIQSGRKFRAWLTAQQAGSSEQTTADISKALLSAGQSSVVALVSQARHQLGLPEKQTPAITATPTKPQPILEPPASLPTPTETSRS